MYGWYNGNSLQTLSHLSLIHISTWMSGKSARPPHTLDINLERYYNINRVVIYTGIPDAEQTEQEKGKAPGFWSVKNFKIQYWDDANCCLLYTSIRDKASP